MNILKKGIAYYLFQYTKNNSGRFNTFLCYKKKRKKSKSGTEVLNLMKVIYQDCKTGFN